MIGKEASRKGLIVITDSAKVELIIVMSHNSPDIEANRPCDTFISVLHEGHFSRATSNLNSDQ